MDATAEIKSRILELEAERDVKTGLLKEQFYKAYDSLRPINILKSTIREATSSPYLIENIVGTTTGVVSGYLARKLVVGVSGGIFRKLAGTLLQYGVTSIMARNPDKIVSAGQFIFKKIFRGKAPEQATGD